MDRRQFVATSVAAWAMYIAPVRADGQPRVRKSAHDLVGTDYFAKYGTAVTKMHQLPAGDPRSWRNQSLIHLNRCAHGRGDFFHWHRHYLANFESICAELIGDPAFTLAYWDWTKDNGRMPAAFFDLDSLNVEKLHDVANDSSPNWSPVPVRTIGVRALTKTFGLRDDPRLGGSFDPISLDQINRLSDFQLFSSRLEQSPHGNAHMITGGAKGHMRDGMSPLDPIFWMHHCNVDRLWARWQKAGNSAPALNFDYAGQFVDAKGQAITKATSASALNTDAFGYTYDTLLAQPEPPNHVVLEWVPSESVAKELSSVKGFRTLGSTEQSAVAQATHVANLSVDAPALIDNLYSPRTYRTFVQGESRIALENARILARLRGVASTKTDGPFIVNVWLNCPYVSPDLAYTDPHYVGSFSFFGNKGPQKELEIVVDLSGPLATLAEQGEVAAQALKIQAIGVPVDKNKPFDGLVTFKGVDIFRV